MSGYQGVLEGESPVSAAVKSAATSIQSSADDILEETLINVRPVKPLTKRESEILTLIVAGNTNKKIAEKFYRTERTIEYHRNRLMRKLKAKTAADLVRNAILMGLA